MILITNGKTQKQFDSFSKYAKGYEMNRICGYGYGKFMNISASKLAVHAM
jgi:hypothetical protein